MASPHTTENGPAHSTKGLARMQLLGFDICTEPVEDVVEDMARSVLDAPATAPGQWFACFNPHSYAELKKRPELIEGFTTARWIVPDGAGIVLASRYVGTPVAERVTGADIFFGLNSALRKAGRGRVFFLGSSDDTLKKIEKKFREEYAHLELVGTYSPPYKPQFSDDDNAHMIAAINAAKPDILWVGMTAPKQESWIAEHLHKIDVRFAGAIGAVFDFYVGNVKRSSPLWQKAHLEWLPRFLQEPRRLWRRMFVSAPIFVVDVVREHRRSGIDRP